MSQPLNVLRYKRRYRKGSRRGRVTCTAEHKHFAVAPDKILGKESIRALSCINDIGIDFQLERKNNAQLDGLECSMLVQLY